jgi:outer membrane protein TolC
MCTSVSSVISNSKVRAGIVATCVTLMAACAVGQRYVRPSIDVPPSYKEFGPQGGQDATVWKTSEPRDGAARGEWWGHFNDPQLNKLETSLNNSNQNIAAAAAAVLAARALIRESRSQYFPTVTAATAIANSHLSTFGPKPPGVTYSQFSLPLEASWEPDLWGRVRNTVQANTLAAQASVADLENVRLAAQAELAVDYFELRAQDDLKRLLDSMVSAYREALELTRNRCDAGLESDEAVAHAEAQWEATRAQDKDLGNLRAQYEHAISVLTGQPPAGHCRRGAGCSPGKRTDRGGEGGVLPKCHADCHRRTAESFHRAVVYLAKPRLVCWAESGGDAF